MSSWVKPTLAAFRPIVRFAWVPLCAIAYVAITQSWSVLTEHEGLLLPTGPPRPWTLAVGAIAIALRVALLFAVPAFVGYALASRLLRRLARTRGPVVRPRHRSRDRSDGAAR